MVTGSNGKGVVLNFTAPSRPLSENESRSMHWAARRRRLHPWGVCTMAAYSVADAEDKKSLDGRRIAVHIQIPFNRAGRRDPHNYVGTIAKTVVDALVRVGMCDDDTEEYIEVREPKLVVDRDAEVMVYLEPLQERNK